MVGQLLRGANSALLDPVEEGAFVSLANMFLDELGELVRLILQEHRSACNYVRITFISKLGSRPAIVKIRAGIQLNPIVVDLLVEIAEQRRIAPCLVRRVRLIADSTANISADHVR